MMTDTIPRDEIEKREYLIYDWHDLIQVVVNLQYVDMGVLSKRGILSNSLKVFTLSNMFLLY